MFIMIGRSFRDTVYFFVLNCPSAFLVYTCRFCLCYNPLPLSLRVAEFQVLLEEGLLSDGIVNPFHILIVDNKQLSHG